MRLMGRIGEVARPQSMQRGIHKAVPDRGRHDPRLRPPIVAALIAKELGNLDSCGVSGNGSLFRRKIKLVDKAAHIFQGVGRERGRRPPATCGRKEATFASD